MEIIAGALDYGMNWIGMLKQLADAECLVDIFLCSGAFGHADDRETMIKETHGVRIIFVGDDYFVVGPKRPVYSSIIPLGWLSMIRVHRPDESVDDISIVGENEVSLAEPDM